MATPPPGLRPLGPNDVQILLVGGPCNGSIRVLRIRQAAAGHLNCHGATYVPDPRDSTFPPKAPYPSTERWVPNWQAQLIDAGNIPAAAEHVGSAWSRLMRVFSHTSVTQSRRMREATSRMDRLAYRLRKGR